MGEIIKQICQNRFVYVPFLTWFFIQVFKVLYDLKTTKKFNFKRFLGSGGMPSSHSAIVMTITIMIGREQGFNSAMFGLCLVFSAVVMYDAAGVRRQVGKQAILLNKIVEKPEFSGLEEQKGLIELLGHTPLEVTVGAIIGVVVGAIF